MIAEKGLFTHRELQIPYKRAGKVSFISSFLSLFFFILRVRKLITDTYTMNLYLTCLKNYSLSWQLSGSSPPPDNFAANLSYYINC